MQNTLSGEELEASYKALRNVIMHPAFQSVIAEIRSLPVSKRLQESLTRLAPHALATRGIPVPEGFKVTTRASDHSASTADVGITGRDMAMRSARQNDSEVCVGIPPLQFCWKP